MLYLTTMAFKSVLSAFPPLVFMLFNTSLQISLGLHRERRPRHGALLVISMHRSVLDAPLVMTAVDRPVRFACHHYMSQVPVLKDMIATMGCFPLDGPGQRPQTFFQTAIESLKRSQPVGIFPEGAQPMVQSTRPDQVGRFHRGFAHLALRAPVRSLSILPVAISSVEETISPVAPLKLLSLFDPSEPLFDRPGWHPLVNYRRVTLSVGEPLRITQAERKHYHGRQAGRLVKKLTQSCYTEISTLLNEGFS